MPRSTGIQSFSFRPHPHLKDEYNQYRKNLHAVLQSHNHGVPLSIHSLLKPEIKKDK